MATTTKKSSTRSRRGSHKKNEAEASLERFNESMDAAQVALKSIGRDVSRATRDVVRDVERMLAATRRDGRKLAKAVRADVAEFQRSVGDGNRPKRSTARRRRASAKA